MRYLGIDYGLKRIGVAISSDEGTMAFPYTTIANTKSATDDLVVIAEKEKITDIVIGESKKHDGTDNAIMQDIRMCAEALKKRGMRIYYEPEFFTSIEASRIQGETKTIDASAAALILKSFLDKKQNDNNRSI